MNARRATCLSLALLAAFSLTACLGRREPPPPRIAWQTPKDPPPIPRRKPAPPAGFVSIVTAPLADDWIEPEKKPGASRIEVVALPPQGAPQPAVQRTQTLQPVQPAGVQPAAAQNAAQTYGRGYRVVPGDSLYGIARRNGLSVDQLVKINGLQAPYTLKVGQVLRLPGSRTYLVRPGDTVYGIARSHGVDAAALVQANRIRRPYVLTPGQNLILPEAGMASQVARLKTPQPTNAIETAPLPAPAVAKPAQAAHAQPAVQTATVKSLPPKPNPARTGALPAPPPREGRKFLWPVEGKVLSRYGPRRDGLHNDGINILAPRGTPVRAAETGVVVYADAGLEGFGRLVLIKHADGWMTAYAHNEKLLVERGETVRQGQVIATVGSSGNVGRPQLHFEIRKGKRAVNPAKHMTRSKTAAVQ